MDAYAVEQFLADARAALHTRALPEALEDMRCNVERLLKNPRLLEDYVDMKRHAGRTVIGHDPETDVYVIVHGGGKGGAAAPHDHGPCAVIYGNYTNHTRMRRWRRLDGGGTAGPAELALEEDYLVEAGRATAFGVGAIHSIEYPDHTYFVRVTVGDVEGQKTLRYDVEKGIAEVDGRTKR